VDNGTFLVTLRKQSIQHNTSLYTKDKISAVLCNILIFGIEIVEPKIIKTKHCSLLKVR